MTPGTTSTSGNSPESKKAGCPEGHPASKLAIRSEVRIASVEELALHQRSKTRLKDRHVRALQFPIQLHDSAPAAEARPNLPHSVWRIGNSRGQK